MRVDRRVSWTVGWRAASCRSRWLYRAAVTRAGVWTLALSTLRSETSSSPEHSHRDILYSQSHLFTQPPSGRRRMRMFCSCFFCFLFVFLFFFVFSHSPKLWDNRFRERLNGLSWNFHQTIGGNVVWNVVPPLGESRAAAWRMANVDDLRNLRYDSFAITRGRHRQLRYTTMSGRIDVI